MRHPLEQSQQISPSPSPGVAFHSAAGPPPASSTVSQYAYPSVVEPAVPHAMELLQEHEPGVDYQQEADGDASGSLASSLPYTKPWRTGSKLKENGNAQLAEQGVVLADPEKLKLLLG